MTSAADLAVPDLAVPDLALGLPADLAVRAAAALTTIADRLARPHVVAAAVEQAHRASTVPFGWGGASLHAGPAGSALLLRRLSRLDAAQAGRWAELAHAELARAVGTTAVEPLMDAGLSGGTAGIALALCDALREDHRYTTAVRSIAGRLADHVLGLPAWPAPGEGLWDGAYDIITGTSGAVAGLLAVLAARDPRGATVLPPEVADHARAALRRAVDDLVGLCTPAGPDGHEPWVLDPRRYPAPEYVEAYPLGYVNLGLAHGLPGVLAALSLVLLEQQDVVPAERVRDAAHRIITVLTDSRADDPSGPNWPSGRPCDAHGALAPLTDGPARTAWCYGAPGVSLALLHAARALDETPLADLASRALAGAVTRVNRHGRFASGTVCHGAAGVLLVVLAFERYAATPGVSVPDGARVLLTERVLEHVDPALPLGVQDWDQQVWLDDPGLLSGAAGTAAVLAATGGGDAAATGRAFLAW